MPNRMTTKRDSHHKSSTIMRSWYCNNKQFSIVHDGVKVLTQTWKSIIINHNVDMREPIHLFIMLAVDIPLKPFG